MRPAWLERLLWLAVHRHAWQRLQTYKSAEAVILRQGCTVPGCGGRRLIYDDGRRVGRRKRIEAAAWFELCEAGEDDFAVRCHQSLARKRLDSIASNLGRLLK